MEKNEIYSLHRYVKEDGTPDMEKIFSEGASKFWIQRHLDSWLLEYLGNQPEVVKENKHLKKHLQECRECGYKVKPKWIEQQDLPLNPE